MQFSDHKTKKIIAKKSVKARIDTKGLLPGRKCQAQTTKQHLSNENETTKNTQILFGGLGATVDIKLLEQVKNLCIKCGEYRSCDGNCQEK